MSDQHEPRVAAVLALIFRICEGVTQVLTTTLFLLRPFLTGVLRMISNVLRIIFS